MMMRSGAAGAQAHTRAENYPMEDHLHRQDDYKQHILMLKYCSTLSEQRASPSKYVSGYVGKYLLQIVPIAAHIYSYLYILVVH